MVYSAAQVLSQHPSFLWAGSVAVWCQGGVMGVSSARQVQGKEMTEQKLELCHIR